MSGTNWPIVEITNADRDRIETVTRKRCADLNVLSRHGTTPLSRSLLTERQVEAAAELAVKFYEAAASCGVHMYDVPMLLNLAIDGIQARDWQES